MLATSRSHWAVDEAELIEWRKIRLDSYYRFEVTMTVTMTSMRCLAAPLAESPSKDGRLLQYNQYNITITMCSSYSCLVHINLYNNVTHLTVYVSAQSVFLPCLNASSTTASLLHPQLHHYLILHCLILHCFIAYHPVVKVLNRRRRIPINFRAPERSGWNLSVHRWSSGVYLSGFTSQFATQFWPIANQTSNWFATCESKIKQNMPSKKVNAHEFRRRRWLTYRDI